VTRRFCTLAKLGVDSLELRRLRFDLIDLIYVYKLLFGMVDADVSALFVVNNIDTVTRGHSFKLFVQQSRIDARKYFSNRIIRLYIRVGIVCQPHQKTFHPLHVLENSYNEVMYVNLK